MTKIDEREIKKIRIIGKHFVKAIKQKILDFDFDDFINDLPRDCIRELESTDDEFDPFNEFDPLNLKYTGKLCIDCYKPQYMTPSGETCKNGHGGSPSIELPRGFYIGIKGDIIRVRSMTDGANTSNDIVSVECIKTLMQEKATRFIDDDMGDIDLGLG
jgi:hypothetical protein